jgi:hypothetical protein
VRSSNRLYIVAETHSSSGSNIVYKHFTKTSVSQSEIVSGVDEGARFAKVATQGESVVVVWQDSYSQIPLRTRIRMNQFEDGGETWGEPVTVRQVEGRSKHPALVFGAGGEQLNAWQEIQAASAYDVWFLVFSTLGEPENMSGLGKVILPPNSVIAAQLVIQHLCYRPWRFQI